MSNRDRILDAALRLFNKRGTGAVSTNHIAAASGISPGNLYYHFRNKDAIIRSLFERLFERWGNTYQLRSQVPSLADLDALLSANYQLIWEYRFAYREMPVLLRNDQLLASRYRELRTRGYDGFAKLIEAFAEVGVIRRPAHPKELSQLTDICWIISEQWPIDLELRGKSFDSRAAKSGAGLLRYILRPYLVE